MHRLGLLFCFTLGLTACGGHGRSVDPNCVPAMELCEVANACCSGACNTEGFCICNFEPGAPCGTSVDCCPVLGLACRDGACVEDCRDDTEPCGARSDCCSGNCNTAGYCAPPCHDFGGSCATSDDCCANLGCEGGTAGAYTCSYGCGTEHFSCSDSNDCCSGYACRAGECSPGPCSGVNFGCDGDGDCCQSPLHLTCKSRFCSCGSMPAACASEADCCSDSVCRDGFCHPPPGSQHDNWDCLDGADCQSGTCEGAAPPTEGRCCVTAGGSCTFTSHDSSCCSPLACLGTDGTGTCGGCLDWTNSGPGATPCQSNAQCCAGQSLVCSPEQRCCVHHAEPCTDDVQCCTGNRCGTLAAQSGTFCCAAFATACDNLSPCCAGLECDPSGQCRVAAGGSCTGDLECVTGAHCLSNRCCSHYSASCTADDECCSGSCGRTWAGSCDCAPAYDTCGRDADCCSFQSAAWNDPTCGASAPVGANRCCPAPGDPCQDAAECCQSGDVCVVPIGGSTAVCCQPNGAVCTQSGACCSGTCIGTCCLALGDPCSVPADCCDSTNDTCGGSAWPGRCCVKSGAPLYYGDAAACCSGHAAGGGLKCQ